MRAVPWIRAVPGRRLIGLGRRMSWKQTFAALRYRNYQLWFWGQMISLFGSWMQITAQGFLLYQLTRSPVYLGLLGFANGVPTWLFMLYAGVVADRVPRRTLLIVTQTCMMVLAFVLAAPDLLSPRPAVAHPPPGLRDGHRQRLRRPGPPGLRPGDGRPRRT